MKTKITKKEFNPEIERILKEHDINVDDGLSYLLTIYYNLKPTIFSDYFINKVNATGIYVSISRNSSSGWKYPLFIEEDKNYEWVEEYRDLFKNANKNRAGSKQVVINRMKKLLSQYPYLGRTEVIEATKLYLQSVNDYTYITTAERFLFKDRDGSPIIDWVEKLQDLKISKSEEIIGDLI